MNDRPDIPIDSDPIARIRDWLAEAETSESEDPNAIALATVDGEGRVSVRMVLLKAVEDDGFVFYTNRESRKGKAIAETGRVAFVMHWKSLRRQVRVEGVAAPVADEEADRYFATRPRASQIGAWASAQSRPLESRFALEARIAEFTLKFAIGKVARPPYWTGFRVIADRIELWRDGAFRLHDRVVYHRAAGFWRSERLYP